MAADAAALVFQAEDFDSCTAIVQQFFREHPSANIIKVALSTNDLTPLGARVWQVVDGNVEAANPYNRRLHYDSASWFGDHFCSSRVTSRALRCFYTAWRAVMLGSCGETNRKHT